MRRGERADGPALRRGERGRVDRQSHLTASFMIRASISLCYSRAPYAGTGIPGGTVAGPTPLNKPG